MVDRPNRQSIIMIIHDKSTFSANNSHHKVWTLEKYKIVQPNERGKGRFFITMIIAKFIFALSLIIIGFSIFLEAATYFKYSRIEEEY